MLPSGMLNEMVLLLEPTIGRGLHGEQIVRYDEVCEVHANVKFQRGTSALNVAESWMQKQIVVTMRDNPVIHEKFRLRWQNRLYDFDSFNRDRANRSITIVATSIDEGTDALELDE